MTAGQEIENDVQVQLACEKDQPYIRLLTVLGIISLIVTLIALVFGLIVPKAVLAMGIVGLSLLLTGVAWGKQNKAKIEAIQHKHDKDNEEEDLGMRMSSYE